MPYMNECNVKNTKKRKKTKNQIAKRFEEIAGRGQKSTIGRSQMFTLKENLLHAITARE